MAGSGAAARGDSASHGDSAGGPVLGAAGRRFLREALGGESFLRDRVLALVHDVQVRDDIDTARVRLEGGRFLLELSSRFLREYLPTPEDKRFVLMHEVGHLERGDLMREARMCKRFPRLVNFGMDIYVNGSVLGSRYFDCKEPGLLGRCYDLRSRPFCLLLPPWKLLEAWAGEVPGVETSAGPARYAVMHRAAFWSAERDSPPRSLLERLAGDMAKVMERVGFENPREAARLYLGGWTRTMPFGAFIDRLHRLFEKEGLLEQVEARPLLLEHELERLDDALRKGNREAGFGSEGREIEVRPTPQRPSEERLRFFQALRSALVDDPSHPMLRRDAEVTFPSVLLHLGRREAALLAAGAFPILSHAPSQALGLSDERVHLYLDVSGSMSDILSFVSGLVLAAGELVGSTVYQFSNQVVPVSWEDLQAGRVLTTGGTDLDCVARSARREGHRRICVVTDGYVSLEEESKRILAREVETIVVVVGWRGEPSSHLGDRLNGFARRVFYMVRE
jgi:hypothetical protein